MQSAKRTIWGTTLEGRLGRAVPLTMDRSGMFRKQEEGGRAVRAEPGRGAARKRESLESALRAPVGKSASLR